MSILWKQVVCVSLLVSLQKPFGKCNELRSVVRETSWRKCLTFDFTSLSYLLFTSAQKSDSNNGFLFVSHQHRRTIKGVAPWCPSPPCPTTLTWTHRSSRTNSTGQSVHSHPRGHVRQRVKRLRSLSNYLPRCHLRLSGSVFYLGLFSSRPSVSKSLQLTFSSVQVWCSAFTEAPDDPQTEGDPPVHPPAGQLWLWGWGPLSRPHSPDEAPTQQFSGHWQQATFLRPGSEV